MPKPSVYYELKTMGACVPICAKYRRYASLKEAYEAIDSLPHLAWVWGVAHVPRRMVALAVLDTAMTLPLSPSYMGYFERLRKYVHTLDPVLASIQLPCLVDMYAGLAAQSRMISYTAVFFDTLSVLITYDWVYLFNAGWDSLPSDVLFKLKSKLTYEEVLPYWRREYEDRTAQHLGGE